MSDASENEMHCTAPELTQIAANSMQNPPKSRKVHNPVEEKYLATKVKFLSEEEL
jgi:hypothetical protein